jgi:hypothetical protein
VNPVLTIFLTFQGLMALALLARRSCLGIKEIEVTGDNDTEPKQQSFSKTMTLSRVGDAPSQLSLRPGLMNVCEGNSIGGWPLAFQSF